MMNSILRCFDRDVLTSLLLKADLKHILKNKEKTFVIGHLISGQGGHVNAVRAGDHGSLSKF